MEQKEAERLFIQFRPMIESEVWKYKRWFFKLEKEDIQGQAYLIFSKTLQTYNPNKASFSTHLYNNLKLLYNYCKKGLEKVEFSIVENPMDYSFNRFIETIEKIDSKMDLSEDAKEIIDFITSRVWEIPGCSKIKPSYHSVQRWYVYRGWSKARIRHAWEEIKEWWNKKAS